MKKKKKKSHLFFSSSVSTLFLLLLPLLTLRRLRKRVCCASRFASWGGGNPQSLVSLDVFCFVSLAYKPVILRGAESSGGGGTFPSARKPSRKTETLEHSAFSSSLLPRVLSLPCFVYLSGRSLLCFGKFLLSLHGSSTLGC